MTQLAADSSSTSGPKFGRDMLDAPPPRGKLRSKPRDRSSLTSLAGTDSTNSPEGEGDEAIADSETHELDSHPVVQAFDHYGQARGHLQIVGTLLGPEVMAPIQDLLTNLDQIIPQRGAAMLSGNAIGATGGAPPTAGASPLQALMGQPGAGPGGPGMGGAGDPSGIAGVPMGLPAGMTPPQMMGAGGPMM